MTARLPTPGGDVGDWGTILNDYLEVSLNSDGTIQTAAITAAGGAVLDTTSTDIVALGTQSAGSTGKAADAGHVHPTTGVQTAIIDTTAGDYTAVAQTTVAGSTGKLADAGHAHQGVTSITAGSNVTVTGGDGSGHGAVTIAASGSGGGSDVESVNQVSPANGTITLSNPTVTPFDSINWYVMDGTNNLTLTMPALTEGASCTLWVDQPSGGSSALTFATTPAIRWVGGVASTAPASGKRLWCSFICDGTDWLGIQVTVGF